MADSPGAMAIRQHGNHGAWCGERPSRAKGRATRGRAPAVLPLTVFLAGATAIVLVWSAATLSRPIPVVAPSAGTAEEATADLVHRFYTAADRFLRTGDASDFAELVAPDLVANGTTAADRAAPASYLERLVALRTGCPDCTLTVESVVVAGDRAAARVVARGSWPPTFLGLPLTGPPITLVTHDLLRIERGKVAEYWSETAVPATPHALLDNVPVLAPSGPVIVQVAVLSLGPGEWFAPTLVPGPILVVPTAESLTFQGSSVSPRNLPGYEIARAETEPVTLGAGESAVIGPGSVSRLGNQGTAPAEALAVAVFPYDASSTPSTTLTPKDVWREAMNHGLAIRIVATDVTVMTDATAAAVSAGWLELPAGAGLGSHRAGEIEVIAVESGIAELKTTNAEVRLTHTELLAAGAAVLEPGVARLGSGPVVLTAGVSASVHSGTVQWIDCHDNRPCRLFLFRLDFADQTHW